MHHGCLRRGVFSKRWKAAKLIPTVKPGRENSDDISKFHPISLLNTGRKVLEKLLINRINRHVVAHDIMNKNQFGFTPQRNTTEAAMAVKGFIEEGLSAGQIIVLISLEVRGVFDVACWPSIVNGLKAYNCTKNLYNLSKSYFSQRTAVLSFNNVSIREQSPKGPHKCSAAGQDTGTSYTIPSLTFISLKVPKL